MGLILSLTNPFKLNTIETDVYRFKPSKKGTVSNFAEYCTSARLGLKFFLKGSTFKLIY